MPMIRRFCPDAPCPLQAKFQTTRAELTAALIERDAEIDLALTALLAQEHLLLVGPPGCGKSLLLDALLGWLEGGQRFTLLFTKFTVPEETFGPLSLAALKADRYRRITDGKLPEAHLAFLDEIFKASSAILNTLLRILNERTFDAGDGPAKVPLRLCVAASNEWPSSQEGGQELAAVFDRLLFRKAVRPIASAAGRQRLLWTRDHKPTLSTTITPGEINQAHQEAMELPWTTEAKEALETILRDLAKEGIQPGDRRQHKAVAAAQAYAYLNGVSSVAPEHLEVLQHVLWVDPTEQPLKAAQVIAKVANPVGMKISSLLLETEQILAGSDLRQLAQAATATAKLGEIDRQLSSLKDNGRLEKARGYVREQIKRIKLASLEAV
jgi:MoxR-like ATPase